jgi:hypothetical protein
MWPRTAFRKTDASRRYSSEQAGFLLSWLDQEKCSGEDPPTELVARLQQLEVDTDTGRPGTSLSGGHALWHLQREGPSNDQLLSEQMRKPHTTRTRVF